MKQYKIQNRSQKNSHSCVPLNTPICGFQRDVKDTNPERCLSQQARYQLCHPSSNLAIHHFTSLLLLGSRLPKHPTSLSSQQLPIARLRHTPPNTQPPASVYLAIHLQIQPPISLFSQPYFSNMIEAVKCFKRHFFVNYSLDFKANPKSHEAY